MYNEQYMQYYIIAHRHFQKIEVLVYTDDEYREHLQTINDGIGESSEPLVIVDIELLLLGIFNTYNQLLAYSILIISGYNGAIHQYYH